MKEKDLKQVKVHCPKCDSRDIELGKRGFKAGRSVVGNLFLGPAGVLWGEYGKDKLEFKCKDCNHRWPCREIESL